MGGEARGVGRDPERIPRPPERGALGHLAREPRVDGYGGRVTPARRRTREQAKGSPGAKARFRASAPPARRRRPGTRRESGPCAGRAARAPAQTLPGMRHAAPNRSHPQAERAVPAEQTSESPRRRYPPSVYSPCPREGPRAPFQNPPTGSLPSGRGDPPPPRLPRRPRGNAPDGCARGVPLEARNGGRRRAEV